MPRSVRVSDKGWQRADLWDAATMNSAIYTSHNCDRDYYYIITRIIRRFYVFIIDGDNVLHAVVGGFQEWTARCNDELLNTTEQETRRRRNTVHCTLLRSLCLSVHIRDGIIYIPSVLLLMSRVLSSLHTSIECVAGFKLQFLTTPVLFVSAVR